jgi:hypothetical protein
VEETDPKLEALRKHLLEGAQQARHGEFAEYSLEALLREIDDEGSWPSAQRV